MNKPKLRGKRTRRESPYSLGEIPDSILRLIGGQIVHRSAIGMRDISGDDAAEIFAFAIEGEHRSSPLGIADVCFKNCACSVKTVKSNNPFKVQQVRLISGRNSPDYSLGISMAHDDIQKTGSAVLSIWNARVDETLDEFDELRVVVMIRNFESKQFLIFEEEAQRYIPSEFEWQYNDKRNLEGVEKSTGERKFTWQFHGSQFTVHRAVPVSARKFQINTDIPTLDSSAVLKEIGYSQAWVELI